jgi:aromatic ring-cleaving dioxygenase
LGNAVDWQRGESVILLHPLLDERTSDDCVDQASEDIGWLSRRMSLAATSVTTFIEGFHYGMF